MRSMSLSTLSMTGVVVVDVLQRRLEECEMQYGGEEGKGMLSMDEPKTERKMNMKN